MSRPLKIQVHVVAIQQTREHDKFHHPNGDEEFVAGDMVSAITIRLPDGKLWKLRAPHGLASALMQEFVMPTAKKKPVKRRAKKK